MVICEAVSIPAGPWFGQGDPVLARILPRDWESRIQGLKTHIKKESSSFENNAAM